MDHIKTDCIKCKGSMSFDIAPNGEPQAMGVYKFQDTHFKGAYICETCYEDYREKKKPLYAQYAPNGFVWQHTLEEFCYKHKVSNNNYDWSAKTKELWQQKHKALWRLYFIMIIRFDINWKDGKRIFIQPNRSSLVKFLKRLFKHDH